MGTCQWGQTPNSKAEISDAERFEGPNSVSVPELAGFAVALFAGGFLGAFAAGFDLDVVADLFDAEDGFGDIFGHAFGFAAIHMSMESHFTVLDFHFDLGGIDHGMPGQLLVDIFFN